MGVGHLVIAGSWKLVWAAILAAIIWERLFGTFESEGERVRYGLTTNIETYNPVRVAFGEFAALWRDVRGTPRWRDKRGYALRGPGWSPEQSAAEVGRTERHGGQGASGRARVGAA